MSMTEGQELQLPEDLSKEIIKATTEQSIALKMMQTRRMPARSSKIVVSDLLPMAYWVDGQATNVDNDQGWKQTSRADWDKVTLHAEELAVILPFHENDLDDAAFDIEGEVKRLIPEAMGARIDAAALFGTSKPSTWPDAIVPGATAKGHTYEYGTSDDVAEDLNQTFALVENDGFGVTGVASRMGMKSRMRGLRDANGNPIYLSDLRGDSRVDTMYGEHLEFSKNGAWDDAAADMIVGDWSKAIIGIRRDITLKRFDSGVIQDPATGDIIYNLMQQDMVAVRAVMRVGYAVANPVTRLATNKATRHPFAALVDLA